MLSAATAALLAGGAFADTSITTTTKTALTTGALPSGAIGTGSAGNIVVKQGGTVDVGTASSAAITVNSNNYVENSGSITNNGVATASGILVNMVNNPVGAGSFTNTAGTTIVGDAIYLDSASFLSLSGSGTAKHGIWLFNSNATANTTIYTYTGDIAMEANSSLTVNGDSSVAIGIDANSVLKGNITLDGRLAVTQTTPNSATPSGLYGLLSNGEIDGNIYLVANGTNGSSFTVTGANSTGISIQGTGVKGSISIDAPLATLGYSPTATTANTASTNQSNQANNADPESGSALEIGASITNGIAIIGPQATTDATPAGSVTAQGSTANTTAAVAAKPAIEISPVVNTLTQTIPLTIGYYGGPGSGGTFQYGDTADPGFSFDNRGTIAESPTDPNNHAAAIRIGGTSSALPTILTGGFFNSGTITATAVTIGTTAGPANATALDFQPFTVLDNATWDSVNNVWTYSAASDPSLAHKTSSDQAALVNATLPGSTTSGIIEAVTTGTRGGTAIALNIAANASVPTLINSGTIIAQASVPNTITALEISGGVGTANPLTAIAIGDSSGTLTSIYNTGNITAQATVLDSNAQTAVAINLSNDTPGSPSGAGVTITDRSTATTAATITGDILFGTGNNQILNITGDGAQTATVNGNVHFGLGSGSSASGDALTIGSYGVLSGVVAADAGVAVDVQGYGQLALQNTATALNATSFTIQNKGIVTLGVSESLATIGGGMIKSSGPVNIELGATLNIAYTSYIPQGDGAQGANQFVLISAPHSSTPYGNLVVNQTTINVLNEALTQNAGTTTSGSLPYLFESANIARLQTAGSDELVLNVVPKSAIQIGLTQGSYGYQMFNLANAALAKDDALGAAMINGIRTTSQAQYAYNAYAPNVTGGSRAIAISITDQATGTVAARQRALRLYGGEEGEETLWANEFAQMIKDPGRGAIDTNTITATTVGEADGTRLQSGYKDHGFGFSLGMDEGSPKYGWYGGALTFYAGDVGELQRDSHTNEQWYVLSGYSTWRGKGLFFDSKLDVGYGHFNGKRFIDLVIPTGTDTTTNTPVYGLYRREADNTHAGTLLSGGVTTGAMLSYGATTVMPQLSVDGLLMREEGYTERNPGTTTVGDGFDLTVQPYYAQSLRFFLGTSVRYDLNLWDFYLQPEGRIGYRYDIFKNPTKLTAAFANTGVGGATGTAFTTIGPDPAQGNFVVGGSLATTTETWTMGLNFDLVRGSNGALEQVGTFSLLGRI